MMSLLWVGFKSQRPNHSNRGGFRLLALAEKLDIAKVAHLFNACECMRVIGVAFSELRKTQSPRFLQRILCALHYQRQWNLGGL